MLRGGAVTPAAGTPADRAPALVVSEWASALCDLSFLPLAPHPSPTLLTVHTTPLFVQVAGPVLAPPLSQAEDTARVLHFHH